MINCAMTDVSTLSWSDPDPTLPPEDGWEDPDTVVDLLPAGANVVVLDDLPPLDFGEPYLS